jgi:peptidoglycan-N-acetylglucosamine deacetylase
MDASFSFGAETGPSARRGQGLLVQGRRTAKALAERILPESVVVWRGREGRRRPLSPLRHVLLGRDAPAAMPGRIALTFDDGPTPLTLRYLDVLERFQARATFFLVGELCAAHPHWVNAIAERGHEVAGHGYTHRPFTSFSQAELVSELARTRALLPSRPAPRQLVRPPYGAVSLSSLLTCARAGFTTVLWSLNSGDWRARDAGEVEQTIAAGSTAAGEIVLLHEGQTLTLDALPTVVRNLKELGHELVTVGELLA